MLCDIEILRKNGPVIVEGHLVMSDSDLVHIANVIIFLETSQEVCKSRRLSRRAREPHELEIMEKYFDDFVWPGFLKFGLPAVDRAEELCIANHSRFIRMDGELSPAQVASNILSVCHEELDLV
jgi:uridine kinase